MNQLVFYVSKVKASDDSINFVIKNNMDKLMPNTSPIWIEWDEQRNQPEKVEKIFYKMKIVLGAARTHPDFKMEFMNEPHLRGDNPFASENINNAEPALDRHLEMSEIEMEFWRKLMLDICVKKL